MTVFQIDALSEYWEASPVKFWGEIDDNDWYPNNHLYCMNHRNNNKDHSGCEFDWVIERTKGGGTLSYFLAENSKAVWKEFGYKVIHQEGWGFAVESVQSQLFFPEVTLDPAPGNADNKKWFSGSIGELLMFNSELSNENRNAITRALAAKWGVALPGKF